MVSVACLYFFADCACLTLRFATSPLQFVLVVLLVVCCILVSACTVEVGVMAIKAGCMDLLTAAFKNHPDDATVNLQACMALNSIINNGENRLPL